MDFEGFSNYVKDKYKSFVDRKRYRLKRKYRVYKDYILKNLFVYGREYGRFALFEVAPFVAAYGLMINFPLNVLLGWALTWETVVSWGLVFFLVSEEFTGIANELKPYIKVNAKVDN